MFRRVKYIGDDCAGLILNEEYEVLSYSMDRGVLSSILLKINNAPSKVYYGYTIHKCFLDVTIQYERNKAIDEILS